MNALSLFWWSIYGFLFVLCIAIIMLLLPNHGAWAKIHEIAEKIVIAIMCMSIILCVISGAYLFYDKVQNDEKEIIYQRIDCKTAETLTEKEMHFCISRKKEMNENGYIWVNRRRLK